nr:UDP-N-acetylmuramate dehydrogenase [Candidatus Hoaglandella endobia]
MLINKAALKPLNTFAIDVRAQCVAAVRTEKELVTLWRRATENNMPALVLGSGSNVLFLEDYDGTVLLNRIAGIMIRENADAWYLHVGAGEVWHDLVTTCLDYQITGLENLAMIPGCVGSAPIQNIGAYGVELAQLCEYVDIIQLKTGVKRRLSSNECEFNYRDSIFKHDLREHNVIVAVGLRLAKAWRPVLDYGDLTLLNIGNVTPRQIYTAICAMRCSKLPDPALAGNAGSFFKNPIIDAQGAEKLLQRYPDAPYYFQPNSRVKLAAGWLIERCKLKGYRLGGTAVHDKQALVLVNAYNATGWDIVALARHVRQQVAQRFDLWLEPEVRFIGAKGEVDALRVIA